MQIAIIHLSIYDSVTNKIPNNTHLHITVLFHSQLRAGA